MKKTASERNQKRIRQLKNHIYNAKIHLAQYRVCRQWIKLSPKKKVYQDFISFYAENGVKYNDLVFVLICTDGDGKEHVRYIHNFLGSKDQNTMSVRYVWAFLLQNTFGGELKLAEDPPQEFLNWLEFLRSGDGGPHFQSYDFIDSESQYSIDIDIKEYMNL